MIFLLFGIFEGILRLSWNQRSLDKLHPNLIKLLQFLCVNFQSTYILEIELELVQWFVHHISQESHKHCLSLLEFLIKDSYFFYKKKIKGLVRIDQRASILNWIYFNFQYIFQEQSKIFRNKNGLFSHCLPIKTNYLFCTINL